MSQNLKIGDLSRRTQCTAETIRYYEREGLLPEPDRTAANYRVYGREHVERLAFIRNCRSVDMTLDEIRQLLHVRDLPQRSYEATHQLLDEHIAQVAARLAELRMLERQLRALRQQCGAAHSDKEYGILDGLRWQTAAVRVKKKAGKHVDGRHRHCD